MKQNRSLSDLAARALSNEASRERAVSPDVRSKTIAAMAGAMRAQRRRRWQRAAFAATAIAATIALAVSLGRTSRTSQEGHAVAVGSAPALPAVSAMFVRGTPVVERHGSRTALSNGLPLEVGDRVVVEPGSRTTVALSNGTSVAVDDHSELVLTSAAPHVSFELGRGAVHADVAKLQPSERFVIRTSDAEIEVHGTSFDVLRVAADPACGNGTTTRVKVREGVVSVRSAGVETFVHPNEVWPANCGAAAPTPTPTPTAAASAEPHASPQARRPDAPGSTLGVQNDLFEKAIAKKRAGDTTGAIAGFEELLARFPSSHLAQAALGERMKLLRDVDAARAKTAAKDYLRRYPNGFARKDAELLLSGE